MWTFHFLGYISTFEIMLNPSLFYERHLIQLHRRFPKKDFSKVLLLNFQVDESL